MLICCTYWPHRQNKFWRIIWRIRRWVCCGRINLFAIFLLATVSVPPFFSVASDVAPLRQISTTTAIYGMAQLRSDAAAMLPLALLLDLKMSSLGLVTVSDTIAGKMMERAIHNNQTCHQCLQLYPRQAEAHIMPPSAAFSHPLLLRSLSVALQSFPSS